MKNIMRAISLGLVCAIALSNVTQAHQKNEKSPWQITKDIGCSIGALPLFLVSCALWRMPRALVICKTIKASLDHVKQLNVPRLVRINKIMAEETKYWRFRQALGALGFVTSCAIAKESLDRKKAQKQAKFLLQCRMSTMREYARNDQEELAKIRLMRDQYADQLEVCLREKCECQKVIRTQQA